jgi:hypothetical protein
MHEQSIRARGLIAQSQATAPAILGARRSPMDGPTCWATSDVEQARLFAAARVVRECATEGATNPTGLLVELALGPEWKRHNHWYATEFFVVGDVAPERILEISRVNVAPLFTQVVAGIALMRAAG